MNFSYTEDLHHFLASQMYLQLPENFNNANGMGFMGNTYLDEKHLIRHPLKNKNTA